MGTVMSLLTVSRGSRQIFMQKTLTAVLRRLVVFNGRKKRPSCRWAVRVIWDKSVRNVFHCSFEPRCRRAFVELMQNACRLYRLHDLERRVNQTDSHSSY